MKHLRVWFKTWLARHRLIIEFCHDCGIEQPVVWRTADSVWVRVMGAPNGVVCPTCFDRRAQRQGLHLQWIAQDQEAT